MEILEKNQKILVIAGIAIALVIIVFYYINSTKKVYSFDDFSASEEENIKEENEEVDNNIIIHVTGAVQQEGIVQVKENARINDVIEAAGGLCESADLDNVNLAYVVQDGQKIYIPFKEEKEGPKDDGEIINNAAGISVLEENNDTNSGLININTASQEKLTELPGIRKFNSIKDNYI